MSEPDEQPTPRRAVLSTAGLDALILKVLRTFGHEFVEPLPREAMLHLRRLLAPMSLWLLVSFLGSAIQVSCMLDGWLILRREAIQPPCAPLQYWLLSYCIAVTVLPCCTGFAFPLAASCILVSRLIRERVPGSCQAKAPEAWAFVDEVVGRSLATLACAPIAAGLSWLIDKQLRFVNRRWGAQGPALDDVMRRILAGPAPESLHGSECSICLAEGGLLSGWRMLQCGHQFHEECLREWLLRSRRCPNCRFDLHVGYLNDE